MPGRTPAEAVREYQDPLRQAAACLRGTAKLIGTEPRVIGATGSWLLNGADGMFLPGYGGRLEAGQYYQLVHCDPEKHGVPASYYRVTTRRYMYTLVDRDGAEQWSMQWHPDGKSSERNPHLHIPPHSKQHLPTPRLAFEHAVEWAIRYGAEPNRDDWQDVLAECRAPFELHRSWVNQPGDIDPPDA